MTHVHRSCRDLWGWGSSSVYTAAYSFSHLQTSTHASSMESSGFDNVALWKLVWSLPSIPKINFFTWIVIHQKLLTGENLSKKGFYGPFRCCLCLQAAESSAHILVECVFAQKVWALVLCGLSFSFFPLNAEPIILFKNWQSRYRGALSSNHAWRKIWQAIPKFIWWKLWLARNDMIFNGKILKPEIVASKAKAFLLEAIGNLQIAGNNLEAEQNWLGTKSVDKIQGCLSKPVIKIFWQIRLLEKEFSNWWKYKNRTSIFFDGVSKGNPGKAGAGGLIFHLGKKLETSFSWGIGKNTNNRAELFALLKACQLAKEVGHTNLQIFGDSKIIIKILNSDSVFNNIFFLNLTMQRLHFILMDCDSVISYHILRDLNKLVDLKAN